MSDEGEYGRSGSAPAKFPCRWGAKGGAASATPCGQRPRSGPVEVPITSVFSEKPQ
jgi:hypothetical protein